MRLLVTGAAGEVGFGVLEALGAAVAGRGWAPPESVLAVDLTLPADRPDFGVGVQWATLDLLEADLGVLVRELEIDACVHCAALTGARAEADFETTLALNLDTTRRLAAALAAQGPRARLLLSGASAAVGRFPADAVADEAAPLRPSGAYGTSKAMAELALQEMRRAGVLDARVLRLPTLLVRRGARSGPPSTGYLSDLVKAARAGRAFVAPAPEDFAVGVASGAVAAEAAIEALALDPGDWGRRAVVNLPAYPVTAADLLHALGPNRPPVRFEPDAALLERVGGWPKAMSSRLAEAIVPSAGRTRAATLAAILAEETGS
jgi:nucleoside-diphosphate-sugar epimerase